MRVVHAVPIRSRVVVTDGLSTSKSSVSNAKIVVLGPKEPEQRSSEMLLSNEDRERIKDQYDIYDLIEVLDLSIEEFIDAFDFKLIDCPEVMEKIGYVTSEAGWEGPEV